MAAHRALIDDSSPPANAPLVPARGPTHVPPPASPPWTSFQSDWTAVDTPLGHDLDDGQDVVESSHRRGRSGLGISGTTSPSPSPRLAKRVSIQAISRRAVGSPGALSPPDSSEPLADLSRALPTPRLICDESDPVRRSAHSMNSVAVCRSIQDRAPPP
ncbi:hypothetical protein NX059_008249 [Plenodomus lindquistii]|nr:hypothetical protein NX059_008249 [Plenodomus lindquistii]